MNDLPDAAHAPLLAPDLRQVTVASPEGVPLTLHLAAPVERFGAFALDTFACLLVALAFTALLWLAGADGDDALLLLLFVMRNWYFLFFELRMGGVTPGKRALGLRVIERHASILSPQAIVIRNIMREVEFFIPVQMVLATSWLFSGWEVLPVFGWLALFAAVPWMNSHRLRAGDLLAGTLVIVVPRAVLLDDLAQARATFVFRDDQLRKYGEDELHLLDYALRLPANAESSALRARIAANVCRKIGWSGRVEDVDRFLADFYTAQRGHLERYRHLGRVRKNKHHAV